MPGAMERVIRVLVHYYAPADHVPGPRLPRRAQRAPRRPALRPVAGRHNEPHGRDFAKKLAHMPHYEAGLHDRRRRERVRRRRRGEARLERVALGPAPGGRRGDRAAAAGAQPLPGPVRADCCGARIAERHDTDPARVAIGNGSCEILLAAARGALRARAPRSSSPGPPSRSTRTWRRSRARARSASRSPTATCTTSTRCSTEITAATQLAARLQPEQPDRDPPAGERDRRLLRAACRRT